MGRFFRLYFSIGLVSALSLSAGAALARDIVLGYIPASLEFPYNVATAKGFEEEAKKLGAKPVIIDPRGKVDQQANAIDDMLAQGVSGIAVAKPGTWRKVGRGLLH